MAPPPSRPIFLPPSPPAAKPATIIFLHGLGDDADGWTGLVRQFRAAGKLPHLRWILPTAPHNHNAMARAWFEPRAFSPVPMSRRAADSDPADEDDAEDDEEGMRRSVESIWELVDAEVARGVPAERIVVAGFSQGAAVSLLLGLGVEGKAGTGADRRVGGVVALSGYLPWRKGLRQEVASSTTNPNPGSSLSHPSTPQDRHMAASTKFFLAHGTRDQLVPMRVFRQTRERVEGLVGGERCTVRVYEGMGHSTQGVEVRDLCAWLEEVLPG